METVKKENEIILRAQEELNKILMERLEEYADEEFPFNEWSNSKREPIQEEITNNSSELLQIFKELRIEMETVQK